MFNKNIGEALNLLRRGAFLTVKNQGKMNVMAISWGALGHIYDRPVWVMMVAKSRFTHELLGANSDFTVSIPSEDLSEKIMGCGMTSGKDTDKFKQFSLTLDENQKEPVINCKGQHFICKTILKLDVGKEDLDKMIHNKWYPDNNDYHTLYVGEIKKEFINQ